MTVASDFAGLTPHTVTLEPLSTVGDYGQPTYSTGDAVDYTALVIYASQLVTAPDGQEVVSRTQVYIPSSGCSATESDRITLPDGTQPRIVKVDRYADGAGQHNTVVHCG